MTPAFAMSPVSVDLVSFPPIRGMFPELFSPHGIEDLQQFKTTRQLGERLGYVLAYHDKDIPRTILHPSIEELSVWKEKAWKQGCVYFEKYDDAVEHYAMWPYTTLERNVAAKGDQGQLHLHITPTNSNSQKTAAQQEYEVPLRLVKEQCKRRQIRHKHWHAVLPSEDKPVHITKNTKTGRRTQRYRVARLSHH